MSKRKKRISHRPDKLNIKKGDSVYVVAGDDKDLSSTKEVLEIFPKKNMAIVDGVNIVTKHVKPSQNDEGGIRQMPAPIHLSNLMLADPKSGEPTRVGKKRIDGKLVRYSKKSGEIID